jgi:hypothetical protein
MSRYSDFAGAISSLLHLMQLTPNVERRLGMLVGILTSSRIAAPTGSMTAVFQRDFSWKKMVSSFAM